MYYHCPHFIGKETEVLTTKLINQGHTAWKKYKRNLNSGSLSAEIMLLTILPKEQMD